MKTEKGRQADRKARENRCAETSGVIVQSEQPLRCAAEARLSQFGEICSNPRNSYAHAAHSRGSHVPMSRSLRAILLIALALFASPVLAREGRHSAREPDKNIGEMVAGTLLTSLGPSIFGTMWFVGSVSGCSGEHCQKTAREQRQVGGIGTVASIVIGCYMISEAREDRKEWQRWKQEQDEKAEKEAEKDASLTPHFDFTISPTGVAAIASIDF